MNKNRNRGHNFERFIVKLLTDSMGVNARRFGGPGQPDIVGFRIRDDTWHVYECKSSTVIKTDPKTNKTTVKPIRVQRKQLFNNLEWCRFFNIQPTVWIVCKFPYSIYKWIQVGNVNLPGDIVIHAEHDTLPMDCTIR